MTSYTYADRNLLVENEHYFYSVLQGPPFLNAYRTARAEVLKGLTEGGGRQPPEKCAYPTGTDDIRTADLLNALEWDLDDLWLGKLVQRFEITKRLYPIYDNRLRKHAGEANDVTLYARLACILAAELGHAQDLRWLNTLLKLNDTLCSVTNAQREPVTQMLRFSLTAEDAAIKFWEGSSP